MNEEKLSFEDIFMVICLVKLWERKRMGTCFTKEQFPGNVNVMIPRDVIGPFGGPRLRVPSLEFTQKGVPCLDI